MIYVLDNGESYSDHSVWFVESDLSPTQMDEVIKLHNSDYGGYSIVFITDVLEWRDPSARCTLLNGPYISRNGSYELILQWESDEILRRQAAIETEGLKENKNRRTPVLDELDRRKKVVDS